MQFTLEDVAPGHLQHSRNKRYAAVQMLLCCSCLCNTNHFNWFLLVSFLLSCFLQFHWQNQLQLLTGYQIQLKAIVEPDISEHLSQSVHHTELFSVTLWRESQGTWSATSQGLLKVPTVHCTLLYCTVHELSLNVSCFDGVSVFVSEIRLIPLHTIGKGSHMYG